MDLADDIAYGVHDLEDAISRGLVSTEQMLEDIPSSYWDEFLNRIPERYNLDLTNGRGPRYEIFCESLFSGAPATPKLQIGRLVGYMISNTLIQTPNYKKDRKN